MKIMLPGVLLLTAAVGVSGQTPPAPRHPAPAFAAPDRARALREVLPEIEALMRARHEAIGSPGLSWGIVADGEVLADAALGTTEAGGAVPVTRDTVFRIASMTKSVTALAILRLRDEGQLSLDDPVVRYVPSFAGVRLPTADSPSITIRHLLTHSAGFPEDNPWGDRQLDVSVSAMDAWLQAGIPFSTPPGTTYEYSNYGFALLGRIVAAASGLSYRDYVDSRILRPLGMTSSYWDARDVPAGRLAPGYRVTGMGLEPETPLGDGAFGAMGGLFTSGADLGRYIAFLLSAWPPRDEPDDGPVKRSSLREMQQFWRPAGFQVTRSTPDGPVEATSSAYGYGLRLTHSCQFAHAAGHGGGLPGYGSYMLWLPHHGVGVYVLANVTYAPAGGAAWSALEILARSGALQPRALPPSPALLEARDGIVELINDWSDDRANALAADNLFLDRPLPDRRAEVAHLRESLGACAGGATVAPENWLRGRFRLECERGWLHVSFTLAPTVPPLVQALSLVEARRPAAALSAAIDRLVGLVNDAQPATPATLLAPSVELQRLAAETAALRARYGSCQRSEIVSGDGETRARLRLACSRGPVDVLVRASSDGRLSEVRFVPPPGTTCVP